MKKNNKGFSLVELIIVIAIMAILAGALAPALIKYINKSRRSTDVSNGDIIRSAIQEALTDENAMNDFLTAYTSGTASGDIPTLAGSAGSFGTELTSILGSNIPKSKYFDKGNDFTADIDVNTNSVIIKAKGTQVSPEP